jgi:hypothetical protein
MHALESLVPGFDRALWRLSGAGPAWQVLTRSIEEAPLPARRAALVHVAVAQRVGGDYARWVMERVAANAGVNSEDIFLATTGSALDPRDAAVVKAAGGLASRARHSDTADYRELTVMLGSENATKVLAHVGLAMLACDVLDSVAPGRMAAPSSKGA